MQYRIDVKPCAARDLRKLAQDVQKRVSVAIDSLKDNPRPVGVKKLYFHNQDLYRIRVKRDYRIIYQIDDKAHVVSVVKIRNRREGYRHI